MSNTRSAAVKRALTMVRRGKSAYKAAQECGITPSALYKLADYKAIIAARAAKQQ